MIANALRSLFGVDRAMSPSVYDRYNPRDATLAKMWGIGTATNAGVDVTEEKALTFPAIWRAVNIISSAVAYRADMHVYKKEKSRREIDYGHFARRLVRKNGSPNEYQTSGIFQETMTQWALLWGNACAHITRANGQAQELLPLLPDRTGMVEKDGQVFYFSHFGTEKRLFLPENIFHIKGLSGNGRWGISVIQLLKEAVGGAVAVADYSNRYFGQGANQNGYFEMPEGLDDEEQENWAKSLAKATEGLSKAHRAVALGFGTKWHAMSISNEDSQFLETAKFKVKESALIIGIQAALLGEREEQSYNSLEMANQEHKEIDLSAWLGRWGEEATTKLLTEEEKRSESHEIDFDVKKLSWSPHKERVEAADKALQGGLADKDEAREWVDLPPSKPDQKFRQPSNIIMEGESPGGEVVRATPSPATGEEDDPPPSNRFAGELALHEMNRIIGDIQKNATKKAKDTKAFGDWLDKLQTKRGAAVLYEQSEPMVIEAKKRLDAVYSTSPPDEFLKEITAAIESLSELSELFQMELV